MLQQRVLIIFLWSFLPFLHLEDRTVNTVRLRDFQASTSLTSAFLWVTIHIRACERQRGSSTCHCMSLYILFSVALCGTWCTLFLLYAIDDIQPLHAHAPPPTRSIAPSLTHLLTHSLNHSLTHMHECTCRHASSYTRAHTHLCISTHTEMP